MWSNLYPRIVCNDGASLSVQVGDSLYCTPRNSDGPWTHVEVGFVYDAVLPTTWDEYAETGDAATTDVFGYVPIELVDEFINLHGGINFLLTFGQNARKTKN